MAKTPAAPAAPSAPPPGAVSLTAQLVALAAGPAAWVGQLVADYGLSSYACHPGDTPRQAPPPAGGHGVLLAINLACLALALAGLAISLARWRRTRAARQADTGARAEIVAARMRFLALCGLLASATFSVAILFDTPQAVALRLCWSASR